mgnify:CR=1 FL=1|tara:strand:- start:37 stop:894 length:858 start_codon:yes stop_codon:yes gene_type:complete
MKLNFPQLPNYEFSWRSLQIEPIPFSEERITLAALVKGSDQALIAAKLIHAEKLKKMYGGEFGGKIADALSLCIKSAENFYNNKPLSTNWTPPLEGFYIGKLNSSLATNIEDALFQTAMQSSSFSLSIDAMKTSPNDKSGISAPESWRKNILEAVRIQRADFADYFEKSITIRGAGVPITFGFLSANYAAHFDAIPETSRIQQGLVRAQSKLWQLDRLRDDGTLFKPDSCELLINIPKKTDNESQNAQFQEFVEELRYEAARRELSVYTTESVHDAAKHLIGKAA